MSQRRSQEYTLLGNVKFNEYCSIVGVKELSCYDPEKKAIERAFRKRALKTHPDKGGDPIEFKKLNDAYNRLMGHICKIESQAEENELANSILIEVSKASIPKWIEKMKRCYSYPKSNECKCIIFEGPYKQFKGRSKNTGPITIVIYEDPPDKIPKIHIRSLKYMAWIAEQMLPVYMHVEKGRSIQFDQWRIRHIAEFGIQAYKTPVPPPTPAPEKKPEPKDPKPKRKARDSSEPRSKTRRDSEPAQEPPPPPADKPENKDAAFDKENKEPEKKDLFSSNVFKDNAKKEVFDPEEWEEVPDDSQDPFPKLYNMADQSFVKNGKKYRRKAQKDDPAKEKRPEMPFNCGHCGVGFGSMVDYSNHRKICIPDEDFGLTSDIMDSYHGAHLNGKEADKMDCDHKKVDNKSTTSTEAPQKLDGKENTAHKNSFDFLSGATAKLVPNSTTISYVCNKCSTCFDLLKQYEEHKSACIQVTAKRVNKKEKMYTHNKTEETRLGETKNVEIPQTHSTVAADKNENSENLENGNEIKDNQPSAQLDETNSNSHERDENKKKDKIPLTSPSKISKIAKPPKAPKLKKIVEIDGIGDDKKKEVDIEPNPEPLPSGGRSDTVAAEAEKSKNNIQMESLRQNLPSAPTHSELEKKHEVTRKEHEDIQDKNEIIKHIKTGVIKHSKETEVKIADDKMNGTQKEKLPSSIKENISINNKHAVHETANTILDLSKTKKEDSLKNSLLPEQKPSPKDDSLKVKDPKCEIKLKDKFHSDEAKNLKKEKEPISANQNKGISKVIEVSAVKKQTNPCIEQNIKNNKETHVEADVDHVIKLSNFNKNTCEKPAFPEQEALLTREVKNHIFIPDHLDKEAIIISNEILNCSQNLDENKTTEEVIKADSSKPKYMCMKTYKSQAELPHQISLDREAIKLSNSIFSDTTKMTQEEMQRNQNVINLKQVKIETKFENENRQEVKEQLKPKLKEDTNITHARQCFVVNNPLKSSNSEAYLQTIVKGSIKDVNSSTTNEIKETQDETKSLKNINLKEKQNNQDLQEIVKSNGTEESAKHVKLPEETYNRERLYKSSEGYKFENKDAHKNRPENLGLSRFDVTDHFKFTSTAPTTTTAASRAITSPSQEFHKPVRNATFTNLSKLEQSEFPPLAQSSSFAFERKMPSSPRSERKIIDRNFNVSPLPFSSGKYSVHFSEPDSSLKTSGTPASYKYGSNTYTGTAHSNVFPSHGHNNTASQSQHSRISNSAQSPKRHSNSDFRAKSEGSSHMSAPVLSNTYSVSNSANSSSDLFRQIQATKDRHRENCEKALSFDRASKPPIINHKLPRPGNDYARYTTVERDKISRRQEREKTVIDRVLSDRAGRATSLENKHRFRDTLL